jgi:pimeloyl-ACP methyl ester carboxylesterase
MTFSSPRRAIAPGDNSVEIAYDVRGHGPVVLCIQGVGVIGRGWQPLADALAGQFRIITFDNRGLGRTASGTPPLTIEGMASDVVALMDA